MSSSFPGSRAPALVHQRTMPQRKMALPATPPTLDATPPIPRRRQWSAPVLQSRHGRPKPRRTVQNLQPAPRARSRCRNRLVWPFPAALVNPVPNAPRSGLWRLLHGVTARVAVYQSRPRSRSSLAVACLTLDGANRSECVGLGVGGLLWRLISWEKHWLIMNGRLSLIKQQKDRM